MKNAILIVLAIFLLTAPLCVAEAPQTPVVVPGVQPGSENVAKIVLTAPATAKVGELVRLDASQSNATAFKWLTIPESLDFETFAEGRKAVFSARKPGDYTFVIAAALAGTVDVKTVVVRVEGPVGPPQSESLEEWIPYWKAEMNLPQPQLEALAVSFEQVSLKMTTLATPDAIIKATAEANRAALGADIQQFVPLLQKIQAALQKMAASGQLKTPEQHATVWQAIARGLRK